MEYLYAVPNPWLTGFYSLMRGEKYDNSIIEILSTTFI